MGNIARFVQLLRGARAMNLRQFFERYGVPLGVLCALALVIALVPANTTQRSNRVGTTAGANNGRSGAAAASGSGSNVDVTAGGGGGPAAAGPAGGGGEQAGAPAGPDVVFGQGP